MTAEADHKLLLAIIAEQPVSVDHAALAAHLGCTPRAVVERLKKLKKLAGASPNTTPKTSVNPKKRAAKENGDETPSPKKRKTATPKTKQTAKSKVVVEEKQEPEEASGEDADDPEIKVKEEESGGEKAEKTKVGSVKEENEET